MSFLKNVFNILTDKREIKEPIIYKESNENSNLINNLTSLAESKDPSIDIKKVENHLKLFSIGITGEKNVLFELQNSMLPFLVLHNINIEFEDYKAQLDFVIITHKFILVMEVKKLFGNIHITENGDFQRVITKNNKVVNKEGMYSPINQVERHVAILDRLLKSNGSINKCPIKYAVTFANQKTIIDIDKNAPSNIKSNVIRHDQIKTFLKNELEKKSPVFMLDQHLYGIADAILLNCKEKSFNFEDYTLDKPKEIKKESIYDAILLENPLVTSHTLRELLADFRLRLSRELNVKPYYIFTNRILENLVEKKPVTIQQLIEIEGFGHKKTQEFGKEIISIIQRNIAVENKSENSYTVEPLKNSIKSNSNIISSYNTTKTSTDFRLLLTEFRTKRSRELNVKPFYIFTNKTLEAILEKRPRNIDELLKIEGIGPKKAEEFGKEILEILHNN
ncbi:HRDC domain-containing protein [Cytobacillus suaedae]|nr:HRDC domain-containing protein [Cytobacillus suaedae]